MSLANKTVWVVGGVGVIGRGIARNILKSGATVIVNSRSEERLVRLSEDLGNPDQLLTVKGSLLPGYAGKTVGETLSAAPPLDHVVAHGAVRYWRAKTEGGGYDETHSILNPRGGLFEMGTEDFRLAASHLASMHFSAAQQLLPRIQFSNGASSYTFVTGDGGGHPGGARSPLAELNAHHVWGLSAALRGQSHGGVNFREVRLRLEVNRPMEQREAEPRERPLSSDIGRLCAGMVANPEGMDDAGKLIEVPDHETMESLLSQYCGADFDGLETAV